MTTRFISVDEEGVEEARENVGDPVEILGFIYPRLLSTAKQLVGTVAAEDLVQEALVQVLASKPAFEGITSPLAYTRAAMLRLTFGRRINAFKQVKIDEHTIPAQLEYLDESPNEWAALLEGLGKRQKACVALVEVWGFSSEEAGHILGCSSATVRSQVSRALRALRTFPKGGGDVFN